MYPSNSSATLKSLAGGGNQFPPTPPASATPSQNETNAVGLIEWLKSSLENVEADYSTTTGSSGELARHIAALEARIEKETQLLQRLKEGVRVSSDFSTTSSLSTKSISVHHDEPPVGLGVSLPNRKRATSDVSVRSVTQAPHALAPMAGFTFPRKAVAGRGTFGEHMFKSAEWRRPSHGRSLSEVESLGERRESGEANLGEGKGGGVVRVVEGVELTQI